MTITREHAIGSRSDEHGNPVSGTAEAVALYDRTVDRLARFHVDVLSLTEQLIEGHPDFPLGHAIVAYLSLTSTDPTELPAARQAAGQLRRTAGNDRERAHLAAIDAWAAGDWHQAAGLLDDLLIRWPTDLLALVLGHQLDFFRGDAQNLRDRVDDGIGFLRRREADWGDRNFLAVHNWWHLALFLLEAGRTADALAIYDTRVHHAGSQGVVLEMIDASALLWRLFVDGADTGDRFATLADAWAGLAATEPWYAFNDVHATMALAGAGRTDEAWAVIDRLARLADGPAVPGASNQAMTSAVGLPASRA
ncbi:MAG: hypothetical protein ACRDYV_15425, partial [Acidimicrobiia bacterium]